MAIKTWRGNNIKNTLNWRGTCPTCRRTRVKILWTAIRENGTIKVCKHCRNKKW